MDARHTLDEDTPLESGELRQLIARLADDHRPRIRDIAETMDVEPSVVLEELRRIRAEKEQAAPLQAQKLAEVLEIAKTPVRRKISMAPTRRLLAATVTLFSLMLIASWMIIQSASAKAPEIRKKMEQVNYVKHSAEMSPKDRAAYEAKMNADRAKSH
ncbi:MAG: hypothetical protein JST51_20405 [Armatimonadetes bacterium]|nr:hypothetical protein [Armatimonadota bacterium]